jgi:hypothetical protein
MQTAGSQAIAALPLASSRARWPTFLQKEEGCVKVVLRPNALAAAERAS